MTYTARYNIEIISQDKADFDRIIKTLSDICGTEQTEMIDGKIFWDVDVNVKDVG